MTQKIRNNQLDERLEKKKHEERKTKKSILQREKEIDWEDSLREFMEQEKDNEQ